MTNTDETRLLVVRDLLEFSKPLPVLKDQLGRFEFDYDSKGVELSRRHISLVLNRFLRSELTANEIESWANYVEGRDDIEFEHLHELQIKEVLHELANPILTQVFNKVRAAEIVGTLGYSN
jgi:hypothetical protein